MDKVRIAVIGTGYLGSIHAKLYKELPDCQLEAICDINETNANNLAQELQVPAYTDYKKLFGKVDAVSIAVPTTLHFQVAKDFLNNNCHCLVEKPFTPTLQEASKLIKIARKNKLILQVGHVERFNSAFSSTQKYFKNPYFIECHRLSLFPKRSLDIGVVLDLMIHDIDIILGLVNSPIKKIESIGVNVLTPFEDIANARITFKNGCVANLTASRISDDPMRKIRIFLKNAYISLDYKNEQATMYQKNESGIHKESLPIEKEQPLKKELSSFIDCVKNNKEPLVNGETAREALSVALKIRNQIWKNQKIF